MKSLADNGVLVVIMASNNSSTNQDNYKNGHSNDDSNNDNNNDRLSVRRKRPQRFFIVSNLFMAERFLKLPADVFFYRFRLPGRNVFLSFPALMDGQPQAAAGCSRSQAEAFFTVPGFFEAPFFS